MELLNKRGGENPEEWQKTFKANYDAWAKTVKELEDEAVKAQMEIDLTPFEMWPVPEDQTDYENLESDWT